MNQASLFDRSQSAYRSGDPDTSRQAARANPIGRVSLRQRVLEAHHRYNGLTDEELAHVLQAHQGSCAKRRGELVEDGLIVTNGETRPSSTGCQMLIWYSAPAGCRDRR